MEELSAWIALQRVEGIGAASLGRLIARFGSAQAALAAAPDELAQVPKVPGIVLRGVRGASLAVEPARAVAARVIAEGIAAIRPGDAAYPTRLHALASPPALLYLRGRLPHDAKPTFGIVGTTEPSDHGREIARTVARRLATLGWAIVSGHARGIDAAAHQGALEAGRPTVLVLPTGILQFRPHLGYPPGKALWRHAAAISEWHPEAPWQTLAALARNRVTAALSDALLVVESRERGGALGTLRHALALGRRAFVVRFQAPALAAAGNSQAEAAGAQPVASLRELEQLLHRPAPNHRQTELGW
jgi:DNA processing protein